jgi:hypothetical protein
VVGIRAGDFLYLGVVGLESLTTLAPWLAQLVLVSAYGFLSPSVVQESIQPIVFVVVEQYIQLLLTLSGPRLRLTEGPRIWFVTPTSHIVGVPRHATLTLVT